MTEIPSSELEYLANSEALRSIFDDLERDAFDELVRLPIWASRKRKDALIQRVSVIRDVMQRIRVRQARSKASGQRVI